MDEKMTSDFEQACEDYQRVEQAIRFLEQNATRQPDLKEIAKSVHLSEYHFQRLFTRWVGISPKRFLQYLTKEYAKELLKHSATLLDTAYASGLSGPGRLHDLFITWEAVTPGQMRSQGANLVLRYGVHPTPFGECLLALSDRGICSLAFVQKDEYQAELAALNKDWRRATLIHDPDATRPFVGYIIDRLSRAMHTSQAAPLNLYLQGTNFQLKVWEAILHIPAGSVTTYEEIATFIGMPRAPRAVGRAVATNPIPLLIPCHRVIRKEGILGNYRYGSARKKALLGWEASRSNQ